MKRQTLEEYLDGELDAGVRLAVEQELAADKSAAQILADLKAERAARKAVYAGFEPSPEETRRMVERVMTACDDASTAPLGRIGPNETLLRRIAAAAAVIVVVAGAFMAGRATTPMVASVTSQTKPVTVYSVVYLDASNDIQERIFTTMDERTAYIRELEAKQNSVILASLTTPGDM